MFSNFFQDKLDFRLVFYFVVLALYIAQFYLGFELPPFLADALTPENVVAALLAYALGESVVRKASQ